MKKRIFIPILLYIIGIFITTFLTFIVVDLQMVTNGHNKFIHCIYQWQKIYLLLEYLYLHHQVYLNVNMIRLVLY